MTEYYVAYASYGYYYIHEFLFVEETLENINSKLQSLYNVNVKELNIESENDDSKMECKINGYLCNTDVVKTSAIYYVNMNDKLRKIIAYPIKSVYIIICKVKNFMSLNEIKQAFDELNQCNYIPYDKSESDDSKKDINSKIKNKKDDKKEKSKIKKSKWKFSNGKALSIEEAKVGLESYLKRSSEYQMTEDQKIEFVSTYGRELFGSNENYQISVDGLFDDIREFLGIEESDEDEEENDKDRFVYTYSFGDPKNGVLDTLVFSTREKLLKFLKNTLKHKDMKQQVYNTLSKDKKISEFEYQSIDKFYIKIDYIQIDDDNECCLHVRNE